MNRTRPLSKGLRLIASSSIMILLPARSYSQQVISPAESKATSYFVPRNSQGSLPVYSDIRNGGTRYLILLNNVRGNIHDLRNDIASSLFEPGSEQAARLKAEVVRPDTLVLTGGRWKHNVTDWLRTKGF